jgi:hypothetical protein
VQSVLCIATAKVVHRREINYDDTEWIEKPTDELSNQLWRNVDNVRTTSEFVQNQYISALTVWRPENNDEVLSLPTLSSLPDIRNSTALFQLPRLRTLAPIIAVLNEHKALAE